MRILPMRAFAAIAIAFCTMAVAIGSVWSGVTASRALAVVPSASGTGSPTSYYTNYGFVPISEQALFTASGDVNTNVLTELRRVLHLIQNSTTNGPNVKQNGQEEYLETTSAQFSAQASSTTGKSSSAYIIKLFPTINTHNQYNHVGKLTEQWFQLVYRAQDVGGQQRDVLTLYALEPYRTTPFNQNEDGTLIDDSGNSIASEIINPQGSASLNYSEDSNYSTSIARNNVLSDYQILTTHMPNLDTYIASPSDLPGSWQSSANQTSSSNGIGTGTSGYGYNSEVNAEYYSIQNGMDTAGVRHNSWSTANNSTVSLANDKMWIPSAYETVYMGSDKETGFDGAVSNHTSTSGTASSNTRNGLWQLNAYDRAFSKKGQIISDDIYSWLRSACSNTDSGSHVRSIQNNGQGIGNHVDYYTEIDIPETCPYCPCDCDGCECCDVCPVCPCDVPGCECCEERPGVRPAFHIDLIALGGDEECPFCPCDCPDCICCNPVEPGDDTELRAAKYELYHVKETLRKVINGWWSIYTILDGYEEAVGDHLLYMDDLFENSKDIPEIKIATNLGYIYLVVSKSAFEKRIDAIEDDIVYWQNFTYESWLPYIRAQAEVERLKEWIQGPNGIIAQIAALTEPLAGLQARKAQLEDQIANYNPSTGGSYADANDEITRLAKELADSKLTVAQLRQKMIQLEQEFYNAQLMMMSTASVYIAAIDEFTTALDEVASHPAAESDYAASITEISDEMKSIKTVLSQSSNDYMTAGVYLASVRSTVEGYIADDNYGPDASATLVSSSVAIAIQVIGDAQNRFVGAFTRMEELFEETENLTDAQRVITAAMGELNNALDNLYDAREGLVATPSGTAPEAIAPATPIVIGISIAILACVIGIPLSIYFLLRRQKDETLESISPNIA